MSWMDQALSDYGSTLGLPGLAFDDRDVVKLVFEYTGALYIERAAGDMLIYLCREIDRPSAEIYAQALSLCHWRHNHPFAANPALRQDRTLVFSVRLKEEEVSVPALRQAIRLLGHLHDQTVDGAAA